MSNPENPDVSVVILTKNSARTIDTCLRSVIQEKPGEILVVDGISTDATADIVRRHGVQMIADPSRSLGHSRKSGVEAAKRVYVMFVDSDVVLAPGCISTMRCELETYGWAGIHARMVSEENLSYWQRAEDAGFSLYFNRVGPVGNIGTIAALFVRSILLEYPFDPYFAESAEDVDLCLRLGRNKLHVGVSNAVAYHYHRRGFSSFLRQHFRNGKGTGRLALKHRSVRLLLRPLESRISQSMRSILTGRLGLVPYWTVSGVAEFSGVVALVSSGQRYRPSPQE